MNARALFVSTILCLGALGLDAAHAQRNDAQRTYRWVDESGVVHYGDRVPPEYAEQDRDVLNEQGVRVGREEGVVTPEERAAHERAAAIEAERQRARLEAARRDRMLLDTYLSVEEIEALRDRRLELLESQIKVTEQYLGNLRKRLVGLQKEASSYRPYNNTANAPEMPEDLTLEISRTVASINLYEQTLARTRAEQEELKTGFASDIARFRELKGI